MRRALVSFGAFLVVFSAAVCLAAADEPPPFAFEWVLPFPPAALTTDAQGNLWIVNTESFGVQRTTRDGHLLYPIPFSCRDLTRNANDYMYVMDSRSYVVLDDSVSIVQAYFNQTGAGIVANPSDGVFVVSAGSPSLLSAFGADGYLLHNRSLTFAPRDLALGQNGILLTLDPANHRIVRFNKYTQYLDAWSGFDATALTTDHDGNIYVLSSDHVTKLDPSGAVLSMWGEAGDSTGQFRDGVGITLNDQGDIYVSDRITRRILMFGTRLASDDPPPPPISPPPPRPCGLAALTSHPPAVLLAVLPPVTECACSGPGSLASVITSADASPDGSTHQFVYLIATPGKTGLSGYEAAVAYRPHRTDRPGLEIVSWHACADLELPEADWPDSGSGNTFTWPQCHFTDLAIGGYFEVIAHDPETMRVVPYRHRGQLNWAACPSLNFDDTFANDRLGWVSWGGDPVGPDHDGCNPGLAPCLSVTPVQPTTWGRLKTLYGAH